MSDVQNETPTLANVIQSAINTDRCNLNTALPASIVSYDASTQLAQVRPQFKRKFITGDVVDTPIIHDVPVVMPRAGRAFISLPLKAGDQVLLVVAQRSLDAWKSQGGCVDTSTENRKHDLSDCFAIPGGYPTNNTVPMDPDNLLIVNDQGQVTISGDGTFRFEQNGGDELLDLIIQYFELNQMAVTNTLLGPQKKIEEPLLMQITEKLKALKG